MSYWRRQRGSILYIGLLSLTLVSPPVSHAILKGYSSVFIPSDSISLSSTPWNCSFRLSAYHNACLQSYFFHTRINCQTHIFNTKIKSWGYRSGRQVRSVTLIGFPCLFRRAKPHHSDHVSDASSSIQISLGDLVKSSSLLTSTPPPGPPAHAWLPVANCAHTPRSRLILSVVIWILSPSCHHSHGRTQQTTLRAHFGTSPALHLGMGTPSRGRGHLASPRGQFRAMKCYSPTIYN
jgi:hypothetical protein